MVYPVLLKAVGMPPKMKELDKPLELFNMENVRDIFVIISLHMETNYVFQILIGVPIGQVVAHKTLLINAFIVVCTTL